MTWIRTPPVNRNAAHELMLDSGPGEWVSSNILPTDFGGQATADAEIGIPTALEAPLQRPLAEICPLSQGGDASSNSVGGTGQD